ncbi:MAG: aminotransferase class I/II-fold pyridoxal phosphate-dependent enzyme, partial [Gemmataceae bacterium]|nr:aminotransferase class I/II-fold pyridoxal phosphate-dependent enzyme [Gemmataceae bacterium]
EAPAEPEASGSAGASPSRGVGSSRSGMASRLLRGHHPIWEEVETALAAWHGAESALMLTSGYVANEGLLATVIEPHDWVASDRLNHASIIDGLRLSRAERFVYDHLDLNHLEGGLRDAHRDRTPGRELFVVTESLFGMEGDMAPLTELAELAAKYSAHLIVDEAHSTGCFGPRGSGCVDAVELRERVLATVHTGGKALGAMGAYVCGSGQLRELLVNRCRHFLFTTALPPAVGAWWLEALARAARDEAGRARLHENAALFRADLVRRGISAPGSHYIVPVLFGEDARAVEAARRLRTEGFDMRAIRPPTVAPGTARLRISIHVDHDRDTLRAAAAAVARVLP